jgi:hypothetical protein
MAGAARVAVLVNPVNADITETTLRDVEPAATLRDVEPAARAMRPQVQFLNASTSREIDAAFAAIAGERADALFVASDPFFVTRRVQLANLASHYSIPATYAAREIAEAGGLIAPRSSSADMELVSAAGTFGKRVLASCKVAFLRMLDRHPGAARQVIAARPSARAQRHRRVARGCLVCGERSIVGIDQ